MKVVTDLREMTSLVKKWRAEGKSVGLVPTMGFFHEGHLSLMRQASRENDIVVVSLFVNPIQFGPREDFAAYPRDFERDCRMAEEVGVDCIFYPSVEDMYPEPFLTVVKVKGITEGLCGRFRPGHFDGVTTVVTKLFHLIPAHRAYFGQKDAQQVRVIQKMVEDLNFDIEIRVCPTVREKDGLALSSRNTYLTSEERKKATLLYRSLKLAERRIEEGKRDAEGIVREMEGLLKSEPDIELEYAGVFDNINLEPVKKIEREVLIALAARIGKARLIDNITVRVEEKKVEEK